ASDRAVAAGDGALAIPSAPGSGEPEDVDAGAVLRGIDESVVEGRCGGPAAIGHEVADLYGVAQVGDVDEPGALSVEGFDDDVAAAGNGLEEVRRERSRTGRRQLLSGYCDHVSLALSHK